MTAQPDFDRFLESWLADGPSELSDRAASRIVQAIDDSQRGPAWLPRRETMNRILVAAGSVAAIALIAVIGIGLMSGGGMFGPGATQAPTPSPEPTASPSPEPTAAPTPTALAPSPEPTANPSPVTNLPSWYTTSERPTGPGILPAGSHTTQRFSPGLTFSVPEGWVNPADSADYFQLFPDTPANQAEFARSESLAQDFLMGVHPTPWFTCESLEDNRGATAADRVAAASANEALAVSDPVDVAIGGLTGMQFDVRRNPDWTGTCLEDSDLPPGLDPADERSRAIFLDVPGRGVLVMILYSMYSAEHEAFLFEAMPIVESFQFSQ